MGETVGTGGGYHAKEFSGDPCDLPWPVDQARTLVLPRLPGYLPRLGLWKVTIITAWSFVCDLCSLVRVTTTTSRVYVVSCA